MEEKHVLGISSTRGNSRYVCISPNIQLTSASDLDSECSVTTEVTDVLLATNNEPTEHQILILRESQRRLHKEYLACSSNRTIPDSHSTLTTMRQNQRLCSPVRRLPNEIWLLVLGNLISDRSLGSTQAYSALSRVCRRWCQLAKALHQPFQIYTVHYGYSRKSTLTKNDPSFTPGELPFAVQVHIPDVARNRRPYLFLHSTTIQHLSFSFTPIKRCGHFTNKILPRLWDNLQTVKLFIPYHIDTVDTQLFFLADADQLIDIEIEAAVHVRLNVPLTKLKRYKEHCLDPVIFLYSLQNAQSLEELDYTIREPTVDALLGVTRPRLSIRSMKRFEFKIYGPTDHINFLSDLNFPLLEVLRIREEDIRLVDELCFFFRNSSNGSMSFLQRLSFYSTQLLEGEIVRILDCLPSLHYLECGDIPSTDVHVLRERSMISTSPWKHAAKLTSLVIHDASSAHALQQLAIERLYMYLHASSSCSQPLTVKLLYRDPKRRQCIGICLGAIPPSHHDSVVSSLMSELEKIINSCSPPWYKMGSRDIRTTNETSVRNVVDDLDSLCHLSPDHMPLQLVHSLHQFTLLDPALVPGETKGVHQLLKKASDTLDRLIVTYQLRPRRDYGWVAPGAHCLVFDYRLKISDSEWNADDLSEYELLYGRYRAPSREEVFWPYEDCCRFRKGW
ncbi:hypothetical protein BJ165DRAFT_1479121 [Panaeolus papilionaceus]|nr:hypothetical protein BJ165DRAFT_1479121 [Panaeolus papilionaceus]